MLQLLHVTPKSKGNPTKSLILSLSRATIAPIAPPPSTGSPDCLRQLILAKRGNQPPLYPFLEHLSQLSDTSIYPHHHSTLGVSAEAQPAKKNFLLFVHNMPSFPPCYLNWRGLQTSKRQSPFQLYTLHPIPEKAPGKPFSSGNQQSFCQPSKCTNF